MPINVTRDNATLTMALEGRLDNASSPDLKKIFENSLEGINSLVLNFSEVDYISSAGLRTLLSMHKQMEARGGMKVTNVNEGVMEILQLTGFADTLSIE